MPTKNGVGEHTMSITALGSTGMYTCCEGREKERGVEGGVYCTRFIVCTLII